MPLNFEERQVEEPQDSDAWASFDEQIYNRFAKTGDYVSGGYDGTKSPALVETKWDGKYNGELLPVAVYYYVLELNDGTGVIIDGAVSIIR